jgi:hypothetical protein
MIKIVLSEGVCVYACVDCIAYDPDASNSYICFSMSMCLKITYEAAKYRNMLCAQPFEGHPVSCVFYNFILVVFVCLQTLVCVIYKKQFAVQTSTNRTLIQLT